MLKLAKKEKRRSAGEGSISVRADGKIIGSLIVGLNEKGKPKRKYVYGKTEKEVAKKLKELTVRVETGTYIEPSKLTVKDWLDRWLQDYKKGNIDQTTFESYSNNIRLHISPEVGHLKLEQLKDYHLQALYRKKQEEGNGANGKGRLSSRSVRYLHTILNGALAQAKKSKLIKDNPCETVEQPRKERKDPRFLDSEQVASFLKEAQQCRYYTAFLLDLNTGMRQGELLSLTWDDVNMQTGEITINKTLERTKEYGLRIKDHTKNKKSRIVGVAPAIMETLKFWKAKVASEKLSLGESYAKHNLVFPNELGEPTCPRAFARQFERALTRAGLEGKASVHSLRHSFATLSLQEGADVKSIQEALGHHSPSFTLDVYTSATDRMKKEAEEKIGKLLTACLPQ